MEMKGLMGGFYRISEWIMRLAGINLLWIICSLPFVFLMFSQLLYIAGQTEVAYGSLYELLAGMLIPLIVAPFTLFPATSAMFSVARKWAMGDGDIPIFKSYFRYYKSNYKQAMFGGLFFCITFVIIVINIQFYADQQTGFAVLNYIFLFLLALLGAAFFNFFCYMAHFEMNFWGILKNSLLFTIARPFNTLYMLFMNIAIIYISFFRFTFLIPFFMGSLIAIVSFWGFLRSIQRIQDKAERLREKQELENQDTQGQE
jgi:uncharacterized membrane protein YesL